MAGTRDDIVKNSNSKTQPMNIQNTKSDLRKKFKKIRSELSEIEVENESNLICENFIDNLLPEILSKFSSPIFSIYIDANNEVQTSKIINHFRKNNITFCFPKINEDNINIDYVKFDKSLKFKNHTIYKNLQEPISENFTTPNILITPLVAFDDSKNRIGMGKGFFDRSISKLKSQSVQICTISLGYTSQHSKLLIPREKHDQSIDHIVSKDYILS